MVLEYYTESCLLFLDQSEEKEISKLNVRGYNWAEYHADIYDSEEEKLRDKGLDAQCLGGGRITHKPQENYIMVLKNYMITSYFWSHNRWISDRNCNTNKRAIIHIA